jgi:CDP-glycerol glycerophosphotransferase (TagB/SpsB family)
MAIVGYPKFDLPRKLSLPAKLRGNGKPTVLYNPHVSPHLSSWYKHGREVLDFFVGNPDFNLIFAPHVMLFERRVVISIDKLRLDWPGRLESKYWGAPNIHIDLGSSASTDMSYTDAADIYLGDVSSQIYEFLNRPRPCVFLNSHGFDWAADPNFAHWTAGEVIADPSLLPAALAQAPFDHRKYLEIQRALFAHSIELTETRSSERAAQAIRRFLGIPDDVAPAAATQAASLLDAAAA